MKLDTRTALLTEAEGLVRRHGYAGFSYADLEQRVGIRKASIHHHFPTKEDLGLALVERYTAQFDLALADIGASTSAAQTRLEGYASLYRAGVQANQGCLCGVLASELAGLPSRVSVAVRRFFELQADWLRQVLADGQADGSIRRDRDAQSLALSILAGLQGAMLLGQALTLAAFDDAANSVLASVRA